MAGTYLKKLLSVALKLVLVVAFAFPFLWMIFTAFKSYGDSILYPPRLLPSQLHFENFAKVFESGPFFTYTINSILVVFFTMSLQFLVLIPSAYVFARYQFKGQKLLFGLVLLALMVPNQITFVPVYLLMARAKLLGTLLPQILPFACNAFGLFLLRQNFMQVDDEIIEAATLDNTPEWRLVTRVMLPMAKPTLVTITLFSFINNWNSYFWPLVMTDTKELRPLTVGLAMLKISEGTLNWPVVMAGNVILLAPILLLYLATKKEMLASISYSGIK